MGGRFSAEGMRHRRRGAVVEKEVGKTEEDRRGGDLQRVCLERTSISSRALIFSYPEGDVAVRLELWSGKLF